MQPHISRLARRHEFYLILIVVVFAVFMTILDPAFLSLERLFDLLHSSSTIGVLAAGVLLVMISGGIDVSFSAIAAVSMYVTVFLLNALGGSMVIAFLIACLIGGVLGLVNAGVISYFNIPTLIVTLATSNIFYGLLLQLAPRAHITSVPPFLAAFGKSYVIVVAKSGGKIIGLSAIAFTMMAALVLVAIMLRYLSVGRNVFAIGGGREAAKREGISVWKTQFFVYCAAGILAGVAAVLNASLIRYVNPFNVYGLTLDVIAAVVLGGARLTGGAGTVLGTFLGVAILFLIKNNLILMGVPSTWDSLIVGLIIVASVTITVFRKRPAL